MKPKEISKIIERELNGDLSTSNMHGCDLRQCLVRPKRRKLSFAGEVREYWIVLEEDWIDFEESKVFFDEETKQFGLAMYYDPISYICNFHDTFLAAFKSM